jgi:eukaryotic-like serine/threonine-protein kinase
MGFWGRLKGAFKPPEPPEPPEAEPPPPGDETYLRNLLHRLGEGDSAAKAAVGDREFWAAVARLLAAGRERTCIDLLGRFVAARPEDFPLAARLAELLCDRHEDAGARPLLERLLASPDHRLRARFLLGELAERSGDEEAARRHLEAVLAVDLDYPKARAKVDKLRRAGAKPAVVAPTTAAPTLAGLPDDGAAFAGRYRLLRELGRGASGAVYVAHDEELARDLALKILHPHARAQARAEARARAWVEARVAAGIRHPGVVAIYDLDEERQLLAMELCTGGALKDVVARGPLEPERALRRAAELLSTLHAVHQRGVVHGDVKPANLLYRGTPAEGDLVLGDFGVARLTADGALVDDRCARGTLAYMSPEQRRGEMLGASDVYAAGVILIELLSGTAALQPWIGNRSALLRGEARWDGRLPAEAEQGLGAEAAAVRAFAAELLHDDAARRPTAIDAAARLRDMLARIGARG